MRKERFVKPEKDAFGQELWAYYKGQKVCEIVERDDGYFSAHQGPAIYFSEYKDWSLIERKAMDFVRGRVLDVGCGAEGIVCISRIGAPVWSVSTVRLWPSRSAS